MKYERFLANAAGALSDCREMKASLSAAQAALSAVPDMVRKNERLEAENRELKGDNLRLIREKAGEYMELPRDADGAAIHVGDAVYFESEVAKVCGMRWDGASWSLGLHDRAEDTASHRCRLVPTAALIGADGALIAVGDIVYRDADPEPLQVDLIYAGSMGYCTVRLKDSAGIYTSADAPRLSHKKPEPLEPEPDDSWEKLEEDASVGAQDYCANWLGIDIRKTLTSDDDRAFAKDIIRRAKKLAGIEGKEQR